jgi:hypothetical protein
VSVASLLNPKGPDFSFDHDQLHQNMWNALPAGAYSAVPYNLYPVVGAEIPAGWWNSDHAQAHSDFASAFPAITLPSTVAINDINLSQGPDEWWALSNKVAHDIANTALSGV